VPDRLDALEQRFKPKAPTRDRLSEIEARLGGAKGEAVRVDPEPLPPHLAGASPDPNASEDTKRFAAGARDMARGIRADMAKPSQVESVVAAGIDILDKPFFGARPLRALATAGGGPDAKARFDRGVEQAYDPAREAYGEGATKAIRGVTEGAASMTTFAPAAGAATRAIGAGLRAAKTGAVGRAVAAPLSFAAIEAAGTGVRQATGNAAKGESILKSALTGAGFGAVAGLTGKAFREGLDLLPMTARRDLATRIIAIMERGKAVPDKALSSLAHRTAYANGIAEAGAMVTAGRVFHPGDASDDAVNAFLGGVLGLKGRPPSKGFTKETSPLEPYAPKETSVGGQRFAVREARAEREARDAEGFGREAGGRETLDLFERKANEALSGRLGEVMGNARENAVKAVMGEMPRPAGQTDRFYAAWERAYRPKAEAVVDGILVRKEALSRPPEEPRFRDPPAIRAEDVDLRRAGEIKARAVEEGKASIEEIASPERVEALRRGGPEALAAEPARRRPDGSVAAGYDPRAREKGLIDPRAIPAVDRAEARGVTVVSSHFTNGKGVAIGEAPNGEVVRVEAPPPYKGTGDPRAGERGFLGPMGASAAGGSAGELTRDLARGAVGHLGSVPERLRSHGTPAAKEAADLSQRVLDRTKAHYGAQAPEVDAVLLHGRNDPRTVTTLARHDFQRGQTFANNGLREMVERRAAPRDAAEAKVVEDVRALLMRSGGVLQGAGLKREGKGGVEDYVPREDVFPQLLHAEGVDVFRVGPASPAWGPLVEGTAALSKIPREAAAEYLESRWKEVSGASGTASEIAVAAEHARQGIVLPSAVKTNGGVVPILETNLVAYGKRLAHANAARAAVVEVMGQDIGGKTPIADLRGRFAKETGREDVFTDSMRALHGAAIEKPKVKPGSPGATVARGVGAAGGLVKEAMLTATTPQQALEVLGNNATFAGFDTWLGATFKQMRFGSEARKAALAEAEAKGQIDRSILNRTGDAGRPVSRGIGQFREVAGRATGRIPVEQWSGTNAAFVAQAMRNRMVGRKGAAESIKGERDVGRVMRMGFDTATARRIAYGKGTAAEYDAFLSRAPSRLIGENLLPGEQGRFEQRRWTKILPFQRFAHMNVRDSVRVLSSSARQFKEAVQRKSWKEGVAATQNLIAHATGKAASGAASYLAATYLLYGPTGLKIAWNEAEDNIVGFLGKSALTASVAGPYAALLRATQGNDSLANVARNVTLPGAIFAEVWDMGAGTGRYRYAETGGEKALLLLERFAPIHKAFETGVFAFAFGNDDDAHRMEVAKSAYYRFLRDEGIEFHAVGTVKEQTKKFRKAYEAVLKGDAEAASSLIKDAIAVGGKRPGASLKARTLLDKPNVKDKREALKKRIGADAYALLETHDRLVRRYAARFSPKTGD
jgi:hypothetical protein